PIARHDAEWEMVYNPHPPYEILQTRMIGFATLQRLRRFARYWDLVGNSGNFVGTTPLIWSGFGVSSSGGQDESTCPVAGRPAEARTPNRSPFSSFMQWSEWLHARTGRTDSIALVRLMTLLFEFLTVELTLPPRLVAEALWRDYQRGGRSDKPAFLREFLSEAGSRLPRRHVASLKRQARHLAAK
ncbi:MAG TPA: DUF4080 domain-containing protein, partial [Verrucomicrobiae bacterium]|nr:DUF4080 domain-containing protein [Verrucomicrobiae bacterium]